MELVFAISATATDSSRNFKKMQDIMRRVVRQYGMDRIHYSVITFGSAPTTNLKFNNNIKNDNDLERFIDNIRINGRGADLEKALAKAKELFDEAETLRSGTKKVLVIITDKRSGTLL
jgi:Mg-chelatase subunit ChlD